MKNEANNYAFIDSQNLNRGIKNLGWELDFRKFRVYLREKYGVTKALLFIGYIASNQNLYQALQEYGYVLVFKQVVPDRQGKPKGNVDADLVLHAMLQYQNYDKAVLVSSDGDFAGLVDHLYQEKKLEAVVSSHITTCSILLKRAARERVFFMDTLRGKLEYRK